MIYKHSIGVVTLYGRLFFKFLKCLINKSGEKYQSHTIFFEFHHRRQCATGYNTLNTVAPANATGAIGLVPSYALLDLNASFRFSKNLEARVNVSNVTDKQYFTKRPTFYPGPGVWPSEGRSFSTSIIVRL